MDTLDARALRDAFGSFLTGVTVVTTRSPDGTPVGFTANSFTSVSLDPPLLLICPARALSSIAVFESATHFAVNVLAEGQEDVSNTFAGFKGDRFARVAWQNDAHGIPLLEGTAASFSCATHERIAAGDHMILVGRISSSQCSGAPGLGYGSGGYFSLGLERQVDRPREPGQRAFAGAIVEHGGQVLLEHTASGLRPPQVGLTARSGARSALGSHFAAAGVDVDLGPVYSIFEDTRSGESFTYFRGTARSAETGGIGRFVPADTLDRQRFVSPAHATMLRRYALEHPDRVFGMYLGDESCGEIHPTEEVHRA